MPTREQLVERYAGVEIDELQTVIASDDYTEEARNVAREQLLARGIAGPAMRGAGLVMRPFAPSVRQVPSADFAPVGKVVRGVTVIAVGLVGFGAALTQLVPDASIEAAQYALASLAVAALGAMMFAPAQWLRWAGIAAVVLAYVPLLFSMTTEAGLFHAIRWAPAAILGVTTLLMLRSETAR